MSELRQVVVRMPAELKERVRLAARVDGISMAQFVRDAIARYLEKRAK